MIGLLPYIHFLFAAHEYGVVEQMLNRFDRFVSGEGSHINIRMCLPFGALFREILCSDWGVFIRDERAQIA